MSNDLRAQMKAAVFGQESGNGAADTTKLNDQGVRGPMQVQDKTFEGITPAREWLDATLVFASKPSLAAFWSRPTTSASRKTRSTAKTRLRR